MKQEEVRVSAGAREGFPDSTGSGRTSTSAFLSVMGVHAGLRGPLKGSFTGWVRILQLCRAQFAFTPDTITGALLWA